MRLLRSTKNRINKDEGGKNMLHLEIAEAVLVHFNIFNNYYQHDPRVLYTFVPNKLLGQLLDIFPKNSYFYKTLIQSFHILKYGLLIKILNRCRSKITYKK